MKNNYQIYKNSIKKTQPKITKMQNRGCATSRIANLHLQTSLALTTRRKDATRSSRYNRNTSRTIDYRPVKVVGKGAFGVVYCARSSNGDLVAIKKVLQDPRFKNRELDIMRLIKNRNCISLLNSFKSCGGKNDEVYINIVMEYFPTSLFTVNMNYRKNRKYPPILFVKLFSFQLFAGLSHLHKIGIAHRDIKPENILVDMESGELKICDFGSAKVIKPGDKSVSYISSRYYRAPELILDCREYTTSIDIWAAGCVVA
ncbi:CMGC family protein kinase [Tritrichomonas foetus]|uniref:CMGC family protein kinase n=1 Tax=Tritrichomonas foetus TaxID=1144522 RepID=A0A1J4KRQ9_9EUKA|nr:CMGC family protein kinase [Tritrichomonas foetus]|eukprot:OHT12149.1 CMGC family protein kinase [Tritrichomonas foetus]